MMSGKRAASSRRSCKATTLLFSYPVVTLALGRQFDQLCAAGQTGASPLSAWMPLECLNFAKDSNTYVIKPEADILY